MKFLILVITLLCGCGPSKYRCQKYESYTVIVPMKIGEVTTYVPTTRRRCVCWVENLAEKQDDQPCVGRTGF